VAVAAHAVVGDEAAVAASPVRQEAEAPRDHRAMGAALPGPRVAICRGLRNSHPVGDPMSVAAAFRRRPHSGPGATTAFPAAQLRNCPRRTAVTGQEAAWARRNSRPGPARYRALALATRPPNGRARATPAISSESPPASRPAPRWPIARGNCHPNVLGPGSVLHRDRKTVPTGTPGRRIAAANGSSA